MRARSIFMTLLLLAGCAGQSRTNPARVVTQQSTRADIGQAIDAIGARAIAEGQLDALSIVVLRGDETVAARGYGAAGTSADTVYRIGSISKTVTALAIMRLVEDGRLDLNDTINAMFPSALPGPDITIAQLLNHTSGLPTHELAAVKQWRDHRKPITDDFVWSHLRKEPRLAQPGTLWSYASSNSHLLGLVVEHVVGRDYESHVHDAIAAPLGLHSLSLCSGRPPATGQPPDYIASGGKLEPDPNWSLPGIGGAGGLCASARDVARLIHATSRGRVVRADTLKLMTAPTRIEGIEVGYGFGVRLGTTDGRTKWGHSGGGAVGNRAVVAHYPDQELTIVALTNTEREETAVAPVDIEAILARAALRLPSMAIVPRPLPANAATYEGTYESPGRKTRIALDAGRLVVSRVGDDKPPEPMQYLGGHEFIPYADAPAYRFVFQIANGRANAVTIYDAGWFAGVRVRIN